MICEASYNVTFCILLLFPVTWTKYLVLSYPQSVIFSYGNKWHFTPYKTRDNITEFEVITAVTIKILGETPCSQQMFRRNISLSSSVPKSKPRKNAASKDLLGAYTMLVSCSAYSWTLKMEAICFSRMSVDIYRTEPRRVQEDRTLQEVMEFCVF
jgi:hypothetical protein